MNAWLDAFSLSGFVPLVLDSMMSVAIATYEYFVGAGDGIIYILMYGFLAFSTGLYLIKMYFPESWLGLFGMKGGEMYKSDTNIRSITEGVWRPMLRAIFAIIILLQVKPQYITNFVINPFLEFGAVYVGSITKLTPEIRASQKVECSDALKDYMSENSCDFLVRPIDDISRVNNGMIARGFELLGAGFDQGVLSSGFMNVITGIVLIAVFFSMNLFMALLIIRGIFKFGMEMILYPFRVLIYVVGKQKNEDMWINPWPAISELMKSLRDLVIAMIAAAFIMIINVAVVNVLFNLDAAAGRAPSSFGGHSITWLTALMTFLVMFKVFNLTREQLKEYVRNPDMMEFGDKVSDGAKRAAANVANFGKRIIKAFGKEGT